jgi:hypothetical protein
MLLSSLVVLQLKFSNVPSAVTMMGSETDVVVFSKTFFQFLYRPFHPNVKYFLTESHFYLWRRRKSALLVVAIFAVVWAAGNARDRPANNARGAAGGSIGVGAQAGHHLKKTAVTTR